MESSLGGGDREKDVPQFDEGANYLEGTEDALVSTPIVKVQESIHAPAILASQVIQRWCVEDM